MKLDSLRHEDTLRLLSFFPLFKTVVYSAHLKEKIFLLAYGLK